MSEQGAVTDIGECETCRHREGPQRCVDIHPCRWYEAADEKEVFSAEYLLSQLKECPEDKSHIECCIMNLLINYGCGEELIDALMEWFGDEHPYLPVEDE